MKGPGSTRGSRRTCWCAWVGCGMAGEGSSVMEQITVAGVNGDGGALAGERQEEVAG